MSAEPASVDRPARRRRPRRPLAAIAAVAAAATVLAACGGGGSGGSASSQPVKPSSSSASAVGPGGKLSLEADPSGQLRFNKKTLQSKPGKVTIVMTNPSPLSHSVAIEGSGVNSTGAVVTKGGTSTVTADLRPGTYTFFCTVPGHREAGMQGTLTVK
jgi:uncharacterized cupredoxin-like copper-binding protein